MKVTNFAKSLQLLLEDYKQHENTRLSILIVQHSFNKSLCGTLTF